MNVVLSNGCGSPDEGPRKQPALLHAGLFLLSCNACITRIAPKREQTMTYSIRLPEAIEQQLDDLEEVYLAEKRLEDIRAGRSKTYTIDEVERDLGLAS